MKVGDRVRFVNDIGGGIIKKCSRDDIYVTISDDNGFDIPVLKEECIVVNPNNKYGRCPADRKQKFIAAGEKPSSCKKTGDTRKSTIIEIDLHIEKLFPNGQLFDKSKSLEYQMDKARYVLQSNKNKKGMHIVFIHGVGAGVLRKALIKEIEELYPSLSWQDASFGEYGYRGAIQVII